MLPPGFVNLIASFNEAAPNCARCRIRSAIPDLNPHSHAGLYVAIEEVFEASLPLLAKLRRPALLLPGPLQVVVKAQRIVLDEGETYEGIWHEDGMNESVVAVVLYVQSHLIHEGTIKPITRAKQRKQRGERRKVRRGINGENRAAKSYRPLVPQARRSFACLLPSVLSNTRFARARSARRYYYRKSPTLVGGAMEFASKHRTAMWTGDGGGEVLDEEGATLFRDTLPRGKVGAEEGTLLVFSNYAAVHRVLRMEAMGGAGSRDFLAFFVIDQRTPLSRRDLGESDMQVRRAKRSEASRALAAKDANTREEKTTALLGTALLNVAGEQHTSCVWPPALPAPFVQFDTPFVHTHVCGRRLFNPTPPLFTNV